MVRYRHAKVAFLTVLVLLVAGSVYLGACRGADVPATVVEPRPAEARMLSPHAVPVSEPVKLEPGETEILVVYSGVTHGSIEACGCVGNPAGGLTKELTLVEQLRARGTPMLYVHPGDLFPYDKAKPGVPSKVPYVAEAAALMGYDAMAIGDQEFIDGLATFRKVAAQHKLPFLSENLRDGEGKRLAPGYLIKDVGGIKIAVCAVAGGERYLYLDEEFMKEVKIEPVADAVEGMLKELAGRADYIVLLSQQDKQLDRELAKRFPRINAIIGGHDEELLLSPIRVEQTVVCNAGILSEQVGVLHLGVDPNKHVRVLGHELLSTTAPVQRSPRIEAIYDRYAKVAKVEPKDNESPLPQRFEPVAACEPCHAAIVKEFRQSKHAKAWEAIVKAGRTGDRECWYCHAAGPGMPDGFNGATATPQLAGVTCQSCHLLTSDHAARKIKGAREYAQDEKTCRQCHTNVTGSQFRVWNELDNVDHHLVKEKRNTPSAGYQPPKLNPQRPLTSYLRSPDDKGGQK